MPSTPSIAPIIKEYSQSECQVSYLFTDGTQGSEIISYNLQVKSDFENVWIDLAGQDSSLNLATLKIFSVEKGAFYELRYRVKNSIGWS